MGLFFPPFFFFPALSQLHRAMSSQKIASPSLEVKPWGEMNALHLGKCRVLVWALRRGLCWFCLSYFSSFYLLPLWPDVMAPLKLPVCCWCCPCSRMCEMKHSKSRKTSESSLFTKKGFWRKMNLAHEWEGSINLLMLPKHEGNWRDEDSENRQQRT